jgi:hypothetical protein
MVNWKGLERWEEVVVPYFKVLLRLFYMNANFTFK